MKVSKYFVIACTALMVSACADEVKDIIAPETPKEEGSKEKDNEVVEMIPVTVTVTETSSRVSHTESGNKITVAWEKDDVIYLGNPDGITTETSINGESSGFSTLKIDASSISDDKKTANFTGEIPATLSGKTLLAFYGSAEKLKVSNSQVIMDFTQQTQSEAGLAHLKGYDLMSAVVAEYDGSSKINLQFKHEGAILKVNFSGLPTDAPVSKVVLNLPDGSNGFVTSKTFGTDGVATNGTTTNSVELNVSSNYDAVFTLCPITFNSDMNVIVPVTKASGLYSYESAVLATNEVTLAAGTYNKVNGGVLTLNNDLKGEGTSGSPYVIDNIDKFNKIADDADAYYSITQDMNFSGATITPIETFAGTLDGGNKTLSNITLSNNASIIKNNNGTISNIIFETINISDSNNDYVGIIGTNNNELNNITINNMTLTSNGIYTGGLTALNLSKVIGCSINSGSINATISKQNADGLAVGGLIGCVQGNGYVENSIAGRETLDIICNGTSPVNTGGLIGQTPNKGSTVSIKGCSVLSGTNIDVRNSNTSCNVGGLIGWLATGSIDGCSANTKLTKAYTGSLGGLIGQIQSPNAKNVTMSYSSGSLELTKHDNTNMGGLIGKSYNASSVNIIACYTTAELDAVKAGDNTGNNNK